jgi:hypothetical protein
MEWVPDFDARFFLFVLLVRAGSLCSVCFRHPLSIKALSSWLNAYGSVSRGKAMNRANSRANSGAHPPKYNAMRSKQAPAHLVEHRCLGSRSVNAPDPGLNLEAAPSGRAEPHFADTTAITFAVTKAIREDWTFPCGYPKKAFSRSLLGREAMVVASRCGASTGCPRRGRGG